LPRRLASLRERNPESLGCLGRSQIASNLSDRAFIRKPALENMRNHLFKEAQRAIKQESRGKLCLQWRRTLDEATCH
jgi:hypothetical protein